MALFVLPWSPMVAAGMWALGEPLPAVAVGAVSLGCLAALALVGAGRPVWAAHVLIFGLMQGLAVSALLLGGVGSPPTQWWILAPIMAAAGAGLRGARVWTGVLILAAVVLHVRQIQGQVPTPYLENGWENLGTFTAIGLFVLMWAFIEANDARYVALLERLAEARADAQAADRAKSAFLANMSHELRTPLNAILGYADIVAEDASDLGQPQMVGDLDRIRRSGRHLLGLLNDILDLSKIEAGRLELVIERVAVGPLVREVLDEVAPLLTANANRVVVEVEEHDVRADRVRLRQCLLNLLSNAAKFTQSGVLSVRATPGLLVVQDTGIGMDASQLARLFEPFAQGSVSITRTYGGTGLGMAIVRRLVEQMDGSIEVESAPGAGTRVTVRLPLGPAPQGTSTMV